MTKGLNPFPNKPWFFRCLQYKSFENTAGKGEIARNEQFLLLPQCFLHIWKTFSYFHQIQNCCLQSLSFWKSLKFVLWVRVNPFPSNPIFHEPEKRSCSSLAKLLFFPRIDDNHCNRIHSSLTVVHFFNSGYVGKQPVAWKEYCVELWLKELQKSMDRCTGCCDITEILLQRR